MCENFFLYSVTNGKNRTSDNEGDVDDENSEREGSEVGNSEAESESASNTDCDKSGMSYSYNIIILN